MVKWEKKNRCVISNNNTEIIRNHLSNIKTFSQYVLQKRHTHTQMLSICIHKIYKIITIIVSILFLLFLNIFQNDHIICWAEIQFFCVEFYIFVEWLRWRQAKICAARWLVVFFFVEKKCISIDFSMHSWKFQLFFVKISQKLLNYSKIAMTNCRRLYIC